jgi:hypothetical protein
MLGFGLTHHLETVELVGHLFDLLLLTRLFDLDARRIPAAVLERYS